MFSASLQTLKNHAARVKAEAASIASDATTRHWQALLVAAAQSLAPVWEFAAKERPRSFMAGQEEYEFSIRIPGHREIVARFLHGACGWSRYYYSVGSFDVEGGRAYWLVAAAPGKQLPSYHDTLGSALLAAEAAG